jgi:TonB family protein
LQVDDDGLSGPRGTVPLYVALSIGAAFCATLAVIGFVTFQHVASSAPYVVAVHAGSPPGPPAARADAPGAPSPARAVLHEAPHGEAPHLGLTPSAPQARALPLPSATPLVAEATAQPLVSPPAARHRASHARRNRAEPDADTPSASRAAHETVGVPAGPAPPVILTANFPIASEPPASPAATAVPPTVAAPVASPAPEATAAVVAAAAVPAPVYAPERVVEARVKLAAEPEFPSDPSVAGLRGTSVVLVTIGPRGAVVKVALEQSSGHAPFDRAALNAARSSLYAAPQIDGKPATASYRMVYDFSQ